MIKLDDDLLQQLGLGALPQEEKQKLLAHIYETLEMRVGMKLAERMSDAQLREFEQFIERNDEQGALRWLEANFPNYKDVVAAEFEQLKNEIRQAAPQILGAGQQGAAPQQQPGQAFPAASQAQGSTDQANWQQNPSSPPAQSFSAGVPGQNFGPAPAWQQPSAQPQAPQQPYAPSPQYPYPSQPPMAPQQDLDPNNPRKSDYDLAA